MKDRVVEIVQKGILSSRDGCGSKRMSKLKESYLFFWEKGTKVGKARNLELFI